MLDYSTRPIRDIPQWGCTRQKDMAVLGHVRFSMGHGEKMKLRLRFWLWILIIFCIFSTTLVASTQGSIYPVITPDNASQLVEVAQMGSGKIHTMFWTPDNQQFVVVDDAGFYFYDVANLDAPPRFIE